MKKNLGASPRVIIGLSSACIIVAFVLLSCCSERAQVPADHATKPSSASADNGFDSSSYPAERDSVFSKTKHAAKIKDVERILGKADDVFEMSSGQWSRSYTYARRFKYVEIVVYEAADGTINIVAHPKEDSSGAASR